MPVAVVGYGGSEAVPGPGGGGIWGENESQIWSWTDKDKGLQKVQHTFKDEKQTVWNVHTDKQVYEVMFYDCILLPDPAATAGKDAVEAEVEGSGGGSRVGVGNDSDGGGRLLVGGCWMVWREWLPSMEDTLCCPSKSNSSLTIMDELCPAELFIVSPDKSAHREKGQVEQVTGSTRCSWVCRCV